MAFKAYTAVFIGINSGLLYGLLGSTLTSYFTDLKVQLVTIGFLTLRILPYSFKFLWAPVVDSIQIKIFPSNFGQRKSWLIFTQVILITLVLCLAFTNPKEHFVLMCILAFITAFFAATYDIAMEAYRIELFDSEKNEHGNSLVVLGFRIGLLISSAFALYLASIIEWKWVFIVVSITMVPSAIVVLFSEDKKRVTTNYKKTKFNTWLKKDFIKPFLSLFQLPKFYLIFLLIAFYKMSDGYLDAMLIPFLIEIGFSKADIAEFTSTISIIANIAGTFFGVYLIKQFNIIRVLLGAEFFAAITNLFFITLIYTGKNNEILAIITFIESFCSGICNITLISYMSLLCNRNFTATHYSILISFSSFMRVLLSSTSGLTALKIGWVKFFIASSLLSIPSLLCILFLYGSLKVNTYQAREAITDKPR